MPPPDSSPAPPVAWLLSSVLFTTTKTPEVALKIAPPPERGVPAPAWQLEIVHAERVSVPALWMPPPAPVASVPFLRLRPETETVALLTTLKTRLALLPLTASTLAPGPETVRSEEHTPELQ